jgi:hypothetical protein
LEIILNSKSASEALICMIFADIESKKELFNSLIGKVLDITEDEKDESKQSVKQWLDAILAINQMIKYWKVKDTYATEGALEEKIKAVIYSEENPTRFYDLVRNDLTKKPTEELNKLKLNFENSSLADGWDVNKEKDNSCVILTDGDNKKYLAVMNHGGTKLFEKRPNNHVFSTDGLGWKKMEYKLIPGASKTLPKVLFSKKWTQKYPTPNEIKAIYDKGTFKKGVNFKLSDLHKLIDFYKEQLGKYPEENESWQKIFNFKFSNTDAFESVDKFYNQVDKQGYKLEFVSVSKTEIDKLIREGKIYLFEIKNKDNNLKSGEIKKGRQNLHTIYWNAVFVDDWNKPKLNGGAELFYQPKVNGLVKEKDKQGNEIKASKKRFERDKFVFHCPITLNFSAKTYKLNDEINRGIKDKKELCILGIDRGEKHLAYYSLIDQNGKIIKQGSFNTIKDENTEKEHNYAEKLEKLAGNRDEARKNWETIGTIKELKDGYISQVVRKIVDIAIENNALIVLENLNMGFKRGRQKIEKQVYQKLELALAKKLNFLVDKSAQEGEILSVFKALQLTPQVNNFGDIEGKSQFGIMLYTKADYTSQTDPVTGWRKIIYLKKGSEEFIKEQIINNFDDFGFDGSDYYFTYTDPNTKKQWTLYSGQNSKSLDRYHRELTYDNSEKRWTPKKQNLAERLDRLFEGFDKDRSLHSQIVDEGLNPNKIELHTAWESLRFTIDLIQQIRNTGNSDRDEDFILSPVRDKYGNHFDSRIHLDGGDKATLPVSGDANGAYNIARKGIMMLERIKENSEKPNLYISNVEWDKFSQSNN